MVMPKTVVVVGAGPSGLCAVKEMAEAGHDVICVEATDVIGGVFSKCREAAYDDLFLTISNVFMAYSDFPVKEDYVKYSRKEEYNDYLERYADHFNLRPKIRFLTKVVRAVRDPDQFGRCKWSVTLQPEGGAAETVRADSLIVATGSNSVPKTRSTVAGLDAFKGGVSHSSEYVSSARFQDKRVMVIGTGESAADMATEISKVAKECTVWARRPMVLAPRFPHEIVKNPAHDEFETMREDKEWRKHKLASFLEVATTSRMMNYTPTWLYGLIRHGFWAGNLSNKANPAFRVLAIWAEQAYTAAPPGTSVNAWWQADQATFVTKNARLSGAVAKGSVKLVVSKTAEFKAGGVTFPEVIFSGQDAIAPPAVESKELDEVLLCIGYKTDLPWLEAPGVEMNPRTWYKHAFPPGYGDSLMFAGWARPHQGGIPQCAELLARYQALLLSGERALPPDYAERAEAEGAAETAYYALAPNLTSLVDWPSYAESLARLIGCEPAVPWTPQRFVQYYCYPLWSCWYRQRGPGAKPQALNAVLAKFPIWNSGWFLEPPIVAHFLFALGQRPVNLITWMWSFVSKKAGIPGLAHHKWISNKSKHYVLHGNQMRLSDILLP